MDRLALIKTAPFLDHYGGLIFGSLFAVLLFVQWRFPLRRQRFSALRRLARNLIFSAAGFALARISLVPIPLFVAVWAEQHHFGLLHLVPAPRWLAIPLGVLVMDYAYWWWHVGLHLIPVLWRFHNVHHSDLDMDVSTATRFHLGEVIFSVPFRVIVVALFGINFWALVVFEIMFEAANMFEHSNWRLPIEVERILNHLLVTPRMHGIHHSIVQRETNSNWGTVFCWWDFLHRTLRRDIPQDAITIGVAAYRDETELTVGRLFVLPFQSQRTWKLPNGEVPQRDARPADKLVP
ncbi:MAG: sterol desaturase family protein [Verrucomicrobiota bacterium]|nr:sterol desaturase family protein [Verrucomicrobiota bacterium]